MGTFFSGLTLGRGHVVYASWTENDKRWQYFFQLGVGVPALPALVQTRRIRDGEDPLWSGFMAPPRNVANPHNEEKLRRDELAKWNLELNSRFELGTLYTVIAGLLNVLAIYDAFAGPVVAVPEEEADKSQTGKSQTDKPPGKKKDT